MDWSRAHRTRIQMRYSDTDMMGHINNAAYAQFLEIARMEFLAALMPTGTLHAETLQTEAPHPETQRLTLVLAKLELNYRREVLLSQVVEVLTLPSRVGNSSWDYAFQIVADGVVSSDGSSVQVHLDPLTRRPAPLPGLLRERLTAAMQGAVPPQEAAHD
ncbi:acyl-CoA thioesterase [Deinococcus altitudinis]|uniref:acyl-CoA thioesterase n=1 Tax=Deinococcus altitudinis TaxID=468914 RepID=UPI00389178C9